jgi:hypothetical protein
MCRRRGVVCRRAGGGKKEAEGETVGEETGWAKASSGIRNGTV